jgi:hypothetical protein
MHYLNLFFNGEADSLVAYGMVKAELEKYIQEINCNASLKLKPDDFTDALLLKGYDVDKFTYNFYQVHINGNDYERLKAINKPFIATGIFIRDQDLTWCKRHLMKLGDHPLYVDQYGMKMLFKVGSEFVLMGFENNRLTIRKAA